MMIFLLLSANCSEIYSQEIDWSKVKLGIEGLYNFAQGDMGKNWKNDFSFGGIVSYDLVDNFQMEAGLNGAYLSPKNIKSDYPKIILLRIPLGIRYNYCFSEKSAIGFTGGMSNNIFLFRGLENTAFETNSIEQEIGLFCRIGYDYLLRDNYIISKIGVFFEAENILSSPESIVIYSTGLRFTF